MVVMDIDNKWLTVDGFEVPEAWHDRCSGDGYDRYVDENGERRYADTNESVEFLRPCAKCGEYPNEHGDDYCLGRLGKVLNACCGHGKNKGYIQFEGGVTVRGYFEIERRR